MGAEGGIAFAPIEFIWTIINILLLLLLISLPIWLIRKFTSIDKTLKEIARKLNK